MYAVIETGGKQYRVEVGTELEVEHLDVQPGDAITLDRVLLVADGAEASIGQPLVTDAVVSAEVLRQDRGEKLISFKYRPKARSRVKKGHRQELTVLRVTDVRLGGRSAADEVRAADEQARSERARLQEAAARQAAADAALAAQLASARTAEAASTSTGTTGATTVPASEDTSADDAPSVATAAADDRTDETAAPGPVEATGATTSTAEAGTAAARRPRTARTKPTSEPTTDSTTEGTSPDMSGSAAEPTGEDA